MKIFLFFLLTVTIEIPILILLLKGKRNEIIGIGFLINLFTWSTLHLLYLHYNVEINLLEFGVAITEGILIQLFLRNGWSKSFSVSFLVNSITYLTGILIYELNK